MEMATGLGRTQQMVLGQEYALLGESPQMIRVREELHLVAPHPFPVLLLGESGTGKELAARMIHSVNGRAAGPFVALNMPAIPHELFESELFGHRRGSFTGAVENRDGAFLAAQGGTLLLDEIGDMQPLQQSKLLRVLETGEVIRVGDAKSTKVDVRVIASTNHDLEAAVREGRFRLDLFHRISVLPVMLPALREHREDIPLLATTFLVCIAGEDASISDDVLAMLQSCDWPGNVRQLKNAVQRAWVLSGSRSQLVASDFAFLPEVTGQITSRASLAPPRRSAAPARRPRKGSILTQENILRVASENPGQSAKVLAERLGVALVSFYAAVRQLGLKGELGVKQYAPYRRRSEVGQQS